MTTYQDPPLQSRRAARQSERPDVSPATFTAPQVPSTAAGVGEPLSYVTQNRPPLPGYEAPTGRGRRASEPVANAPAETSPQPGAESRAAQPQAFRPRDFSPEARGTSPAWAPEYGRDTGLVEYHTQARANAIPGGGASVAASLASEPSGIVEETLSRRELRAIRDAQGITVVPADPNPGHLPAGFPQPVVPSVPARVPTPAPSTQLDSVRAEFDALAVRVGSEAARPAGTEPRRSGRRAAVDAAPEDGFGAFDPVFAAPGAVQPQPYAPEPYAPEQPEPQQVAQPTTGERPVGHWTTQAEIDDQVQVSDATISRTIRSGAITTSALVLPSLPGHNMTTGEIMLTDSINLPSALAATGAHTPLDESDIDHLLDPGDHQLVNTDSVPIRAIKVVSSNSSSRKVINAHKPARTNRALTALIVSASVMVVVVVTLLIVAVVSDVL